jgi:UDP-N-acetyl-2-amino-2-deoxyglucuronate dehydrogenase
MYDEQNGYNEKKNGFPDRKIGYAIIGCGNIGPSHAEGVLACKDAKLVAVCDIIEEKARNMAAKYGSASYFTDYREMLQSEEIDIVSLCTPSGMHGDMVLDCARVGKHVLCEKPIEISKGKMDAMINACTDAGVKLGAVFQNRTYSGTIRARKMIKDGELGRILIADGYCKEYRSPEYYKSASWRGTWALDGGGCLMNQGVHCIDLLCWFAPRSR